MKHCVRETRDSIHNELYTGSGKKAGESEH